MNVLAAYDHALQTAVMITETHTGTKTEKVAVTCVTGREAGAAGLHTSGGERKERDKGRCIGRRQRSALSYPNHFGTNSGVTIGVLAL